MGVPDSGKERMKMGPIHFLKKRVAPHLPAVILLSVFLMTGVAKLLGDSDMAANFARWGYPLWFMYVAGGMEVAGAVLAGIPQTRLTGALLLGIVMIGAVGTHLVSGETKEAIPACILLIIAGIEVVKHVLVATAKKY